MNLDRIRVRIREMIRTGTLPCEEEPRRVWAGEGGGKPCDACGETIGPDEAEFEVDLSGGQTARMHRACHEIWLEECDELMRPG